MLKQMIRNNKILVLIVSINLIWLVVFGAAFMYLTDQNARLANNSSLTSAPPIKPVVQDEMIQRSAPVPLAHEFASISTEPVTSNGSTQPHENEFFQGVPPQWDCSLYFCEDNDPAIFPALSRVMIDLKNQQQNLSFISLPPIGELRPSTSSMLLVVDPNCPQSQQYFSAVVQNLRLEGHAFRVLVTSYFPLDGLPQRNKAILKKVLCDKNPQRALMHAMGVDRFYNYDNDANSTCDIQTLLTPLKSLLSEYKLDNQTPISFTPTSFIYGNQPIHAVKNVL